MDSFFNEEIRCGYLVTEEAKRLWAVELDLLEQFIKACDEYGLVYYAMFGTMLGAVRHGGFIPWDDDIDLAMPRADYDRLRKMPEVFESPYFLQTPENDPSACSRYMRLQNIGTAHIRSPFPSSMIRGGAMGICIDILPLDDVPSGIHANKLAKSAAKCQRLRYLRAAIDENGWEKTPEWKREACEKTRDKSYEGLTARYHKICSRYSRLKGLSRYYSSPVMERERFGILMRKSDFAGSVAMPFEHLSVSVPIGYKNLIDELYENGMELPDESDREPSHEGIVDAEKPYTEYMSTYTDLFKGLGGKRVLIFGAGDMLRIYMKRYGKRFPPVCTFDNDRKKWGKLAHGVPVRSPKELPEMMDDDTRLIIASLYHREIAEQICIMGAQDYYVFIDGWNYEIDG